MTESQIPQTSPSMSFPGAISQCLRKYAEFNGRATRAEFWWWVLAVTLVSFALNAINTLINALSGPYFLEFLPVHFLSCGAAAQPGRHHPSPSRHRQKRVVAGGMVCHRSRGRYSVGRWRGGERGGGLQWFRFVAGWTRDFWIPIAVGALVSVLVWIGLFIWWLVWMVKQGQAGPNRHGADPRAWADQPVVQ